MADTHDARMERYRSTALRVIEQIYETGREAQLEVQTEVTSAFEKRVADLEKELEDARRELRNMGKELSIAKTKLTETSEVVRKLTDAPTKPLADNWRRLVSESSCAGATVRLTNKNIRVDVDYVVDGETKKATATIGLPVSRTAFTQQELVNAVGAAVYDLRTKLPKGAQLLVAGQREQVPAPVAPVA